MTRLERVKDAIKILKKSLDTSSPDRMMVEAYSLILAHTQHWPSECSEIEIQTLKEYSFIDLYERARVVKQRRIYIAQLSALND